MLKSLCIAFKTYSRLPVPEVEWNERNMKYAICFFPLIGAVIGGFEFLWRYLADVLGCGTVLYAAIAAAIPLLITGGIHMDGFCDTVDALSSHQSRERKLEILKDPHAGAFAVIFAALWILVFAACFTRLTSWQSLWLAGFGFVLSRSLSGLAVVLFRNARKKGMLYAFSGTAEVQIVRFAMLGFLLVSVVFLIVLGGWRGLLCAAANGAVFLYYRYMSYKQFGGITGDLAGWFLQMAELATVLCAALSA